MANTEGLSDEAIHTLLAVSPTEKNQNKKLSSHRLHHMNANGAPVIFQSDGPIAPRKVVSRFPRRCLASRNRDMDLVEGERPAARVIRSSQPPVIHSSSVKTELPMNTANSDVSSAGSTTLSKNMPTSQVDRLDDNNEVSQPILNQKPIFLSESIRERPVTVEVDCSKNFEDDSMISGTMAIKSRYKQRISNKNGLRISDAPIIPTIGGFPSVNAAPVGSLTRKGRSLREDIFNCDGQRSMQSATSPNVDLITHSKSKNVPIKSSNLKNSNFSAEIEMASKSMLANMSPHEVIDGLHEIKSILSPESIEFLKNRGQKKLLNDDRDRRHGEKTLLSNPLHLIESCTLTSEEDKIMLEGQRVRQEKETTARILTSVRTPDDMDSAYEIALELGLAPELPSSSLETCSFSTDKSDPKNEQSILLDNLHVVTSLLRSTSERQRLLGARSLCSLLEKDFNKMIESRHNTMFSCSKDERVTLKLEYPPLLPVALRCLLDDSIAASHTSIGRSLLSLGFKSIHYLMMLFVHPYHLVCLDQTTNGTFIQNPFVFYQTDFMSDISHLPTGNELYIPTSIEPIEHEEENNAFYLVDSSATTAESDSKAFYNDPAWTLLSRMRILPCLSDAILCLSKNSSFMMSETNVSRVCGILAMLSIRSVGAAGAISNHKYLLPSIISYCLSPHSHENVSTKNNTSLYRPQIALPALRLLCLLAQQSRSIAELEVPYETVIPDLHAIICCTMVDEEEQQMQIWSLLLIRLLLRYGLSINHFPSLVTISVSKMSSSTVSKSVLSTYFTVFSSICDNAKVISTLSSFEELERNRSISEDCLRMVGVWLSSMVNQTIKLLPETFKEISDFDDQSVANVKLAASKLMFISSYISATTPSSCVSSNILHEEMKTTFIPMVSIEDCTEVYNSMLKSNILTPALNIALGWAYCAHWEKINDIKKYSIEQEASACFLIKSFMGFVSVIEQEDLNHFELFEKIMLSLRKARLKHLSLASIRESMNPARQAWFIQAEFSVLKHLCNAKYEVVEQNFLSSYAFSLLGRLNIGDEALAHFIFCQDKLFKVNGVFQGMRCSNKSRESFLQSLFLRELCSSNERILQFHHSSFLHSTNIPLLTHLSRLQSLQCKNNFRVMASDGILLPIGSIWMWNVLSSAMIFNSNSLSSINLCLKNATHLLCHTLSLHLQLEVSHNESSLPSLINNGTKLYHTANVCLYPQAILQEDFVRIAISLLYKEFTSSQSESTLVHNFIEACVCHSRTSKHKHSEASSRVTIEDVNDVESLTSLEKGSGEEMKALTDFVDDMCDSFIEYGGQYDACAYFMRFLLRHEFPTEITTIVLRRLHHILNVLTVDEERDELFDSLYQSVRGGLPRLDFSRRDPGALLDAFSESLREDNKKISRNDYIYMLAVAILGRNLSSSSQRCECGFQAMKQRLWDMPCSIFYDIVQVSERFLRDGVGSKESLITSAMDICLDSQKDIRVQDESVRSVWRWEKGNQDAVWNEVIRLLQYENKSY